MEDYALVVRVGGALIIAFLLNFLLRRIIKLFINRYAKRVSADATSFSFLKNSVGFIIFCVAAIYILQYVPGLKQVKTALFASAGIFAAIIGFAAQKAFANIIGGVFILIFRPFRVGDVVFIGTEYRGIVEEITLRHIIIRNYENRRIIIPNGIISDETIVNSSISDSRIKKHIEFTVDFNSDIEKAHNIIREEAEKHPLTLDVRKPEDVEKGSYKVIVRTIELMEYAIKLRAYVWAKDSDDAFIINCDLNNIIVRRFKEAGISIPYPYRNVIIQHANKQEEESL
ncbi:mechanosensitive ion channel family protein [Carboxylicivirga mesophila]|uniref:Mechanosensitive ion channel family protein n=1 Tax=Carboxylicivirga mesophila TaxID=1166478 RepID=A0ABS5KBW1_9BACT|nr:mechanosensitive ion channel family protein [Carboxylicivirga mesophila]MBS2211833.1 mechanosensitive ion channel family protein [Carboxylicivirga mesophila]